VSSRQFLRCLPLAAIALAAACSERLDSSANCPVLCTDNALVFKDTILDIVVSDSAFPGFTGIGERWPAPALATVNDFGFLNESFVPVVSRPDSVDIRQVFRFDTLPRTLSPTDSTQVTAVTDSKLLLVLDTARSLLPSGSTTVSIYDVDDSTLTVDTVQSAIAARFTPARLLTTRTFTRAEVLADTLVGLGSLSSSRAFPISIPNASMLRLVKERKRIRLGLRITSGSSAALRFVAPTRNAPELTPRVTYDPSPDTAVRPWVVGTQFGDGSASGLQFRSQTLVVRDRTVLLNDGSLEAGGMAGVRSLLKVQVPRRFLDTVTIVRASLDLTQRPLRFTPGATDGVRLRMRVGIAGPALGSDPRRLVEFLDPTIEGVQLPSLRILPADSGVKSFDVGGALRVWLTQDSTIATSFILYSEGETFQEQRPAFFSRRNSNPAVRPRLRVTYTLRREGAIP